MNVKKSKFADQFYPGNADALLTILEEYYKNVKISVNNEKIISGICPHAGYIYSGFTAMHFYKLLKKEYERIVIIGPSHKRFFNGFALLEEDYWETPLGEMEIDNKFNELLEDNVFFYDSSIHNVEHSVEVQIPFLHFILGNIKIVPIVMGQQNFKNIEYFINKIRLLNPKNTLFIASSDLYHGYDYKQAHIIDKKTIESISSNDYKTFYKYFIDQEMVHDAPACGGGPIAIILGINKVFNAKINVLHYTTSSDITKNYNTYTVGYVSCSGNIIL